MKLVSSFLLLSGLPLFAEFVGSIERLSPELDKLLASDAQIEKLTTGFQWAEGPVWDAKNERLLFSDVPQNTAFSWDEKNGLQVFLKPSGFTGPSELNLSGSNGLAFDTKGQLISCEHGDRRVSFLTQDGGKRTLVDNYEGKRFNSPNDLVLHSSGSFFFTDPPYGLPRQGDTPLRELKENGVYRVDPDGTVTLVIPDLVRPNGIALSPDEKTLYIAQSHRPEAHILAYPLKDDLTCGPKTILYDATPLAETDAGLPDGLKIDESGNIWTTGPGGVLILTPEGTLLGRILTGRKTANVGWGNDGSTLYLTAHQDLLRIKTLVKGTGW